MIPFNSLIFVETSDSTLALSDRLPQQKSYISIHGRTWCILTSVCHPKCEVLSCGKQKLWSFLSSPRWGLLALEVEGENKICIFIFTCKPSVFDPFVCPKYVHLSVGFQNVICFFFLSKFHSVRVISKHRSLSEVSYSLAMQKLLYATWYPDERLVA